MSVSVPTHRRPAVREALTALSRAQRVLLTTHVNADGDGAGCEVAVAEWLRWQGKDAWIVNPTPFPETFAFLLRDPHWCLDPGSPRAEEVARAADLALILDTSEPSRIGRVVHLIGDVPRMVIDHHPPGPGSVSGITLIDPEAGATGELVYDLISSSGKDWPPGVAPGLYVAILTDTGSFRFSNASPRIHRIAAELLERDVDPERTYRRVYADFPVRRLRLLHASLGQLEVDPGGDLAWMTVPASAYQALSATPDDLEGLVDYPRDLEGVQVGVLFRETPKGATKVSFRSTGNVDVNLLARGFGGGGHAKASGALIDGPLEEVRETVLNVTREAIRLGSGKVGEA